MHYILLQYSHINTQHYSTHPDFVISDKEDKQLKSHTDMYYFLLFPT